MANAQVIRRSEIVKQRKDDYAEIQKMMNSEQKRIFGGIARFKKLDDKIVAQKKHYA